MRPGAHIELTVASFLFCLLVFLFISCSSSSQIQGDTSPREVDLSAFDQVQLQILSLYGGFVNISDLYVSPAEILYITDATRHYLYRFHSRSGIPDSLGGQGSGNYQFNNPIAIHASNDLKLFIVDKGNRRIQMFDRRFQYLGTVQLTGTRTRPISYNPATLCMNNSGELFFWDDDERKFRKTSANLELDEQFNPDMSFFQSGPAACEITETGLYLLDRTTGLIHRYSEFGRYLGYLGGFGQIYDLAVSDLGLFLLGEKHVIHAGINGDIQKIYLLPDKEFIRIAPGSEKFYLTTKTEVFSAEM